MLFGPIRAVVIDDEPIHLLTITNGLSAAGIPCASHWFNRETNDLVPPPPVNGYAHLRLVIMDLNLRELIKPDSQTLFYSVVDALKKIISSDSGPYILVFWTQVSTEVNAVKNLFFEHGRLDGIPPPIEVMELRKGPFLPIVKQADDFKIQMQLLYLDIASKTVALKQEIAKITSQNPLFNTICGWESRASEAAAQTINSIGSRAREDADQNYLGVSASTATVLAEIAYEAVGSTTANANPARALDAGIMEILVDQFSASVDSDEYARNVKDAIGSEIMADRKFRDPNQMAASLNTYFHIESNGSFKATDRGVVLAADGLLTRENLGKDPVSLMKSEFLQSVNQVLKSLKIPTEQEASKRIDLNAKFTELKAAAKLVLVEVGADCDHAQAKPRTRRYLIGLEVPIQYVEFIKDCNGRVAHEALQCLGPWSHNNDGAIYLLISCRRYWTWQQSTLPNAVIKYRLRNSIVNKLLHHYTVWSNRPGIVEFRPKHVDLGV